MLAGIRRRGVMFQNVLLELVPAIMVERGGFETRIEECPPH